MLINKICLNIRSVIKEMLVLVLPVKPKIYIDTPYYSQWEDKKLVKDIILKHKTPKDDKLWRKSGAKSIEGYEFWTWHICGMACLKMILKKKKVKNFPTLKLAKKATTYGTYVVKTNDIDGLFYQPFCNFIKKEFNLDSNYSSHLSLKRILYELGSDKYVIASVHPSIRLAQNDKAMNQKNHKGGHLVLINGYDLNNKKIFFQNPSGFYKESQENQSLNFDVFNSYFAHRGIII